MSKQECKAFIGGLSWGTTDEKLRRYFENYGSVLEAFVSYDRKTGRPRGFGFVVFESPDVVDKVVSLNHTIDRREVEAKRAVPRDESNSTAPTENVSNVRTRKVFVGGLAPTVDDATFQEYFRQFGEVEDAVVMYDHVSRRPRGFGFITFTEEEAVEKVFGQGFIHTIHNKPIEIKRAVPRDQMPAARRGPTPLGPAYPPRPDYPAPAVAMRLGPGPYPHPPPLGPASAPPLLRPGFPPGAPPPGPTPRAPDLPAETLFQMAGLHAAALGGAFGQGLSSTGPSSLPDALRGAGDVAGVLQQLAAGVGLGGMAAALPHLNPHLPPNDPYGLASSAPPATVPHTAAQHPSPALSLPAEDVVTHSFGGTGAGAGAVPDGSTSPLLPPLPSALPNCASEEPSAPLGGAFSTGMVSSAFPLSLDKMTHDFSLGLGLQGTVAPDWS